MSEIFPANPKIIPRSPIYEIRRHTPPLATRHPHHGSSRCHQPTPQGHRRLHHHIPPSPPPTAAANNTTKAADPAATATTPPLPL
nr:hypothetical protein [Tanacetum cinerariifolium]